MRHNFKNISLDKLNKDLNIIEYQLNRNKDYSKDINNIYKKENNPSSYPIEDMRSNENHIRHIVKNEFIKLFQHEMEKISKNLGKNINNNKLKIANIEYKLSLIQNFKESINDIKKNIYNEKNNLIDNDKFLKKDEFELKMKQIKVDILEEIRKTDYKNEINKLKYIYDNIILKIKTMKEDLNKIYRNTISNSENIKDENLKKQIFDFNKIERNLGDLEKK